MSEADLRDRLSQGHPKDVDDYLTGARRPDWKFVEAFLDAVVSGESELHSYLKIRLRPVWENPEGGGGDPATWLEEVQEKAAARQVQLQVRRSMQNIDDLIGQIKQILPMLAQWVAAQGAERGHQEQFDAAVAFQADLDARLRTAEQQQERAEKLGDEAGSRHRGTGAEDGLDSGARSWPSSAPGTTDVTHRIPSLADIAGSGSAEILAQVDRVLRTETATLDRLSSALAYSKKLALASGPGQHPRRQLTVSFGLAAVAVLTAVALLVPWLMPRDDKVPTPQPTATRQVPSLTAMSADGGVTSVAFSSNEKFVAAGDSNGTVHVWPVGSRTASCSMTDPDRSAVNAVTFTTGYLLAVADSAGRVYFWDCEAHVATTLTDPTGSSIRSLAVSSDGNYLAIGDAVGHVYTWPMQNGEPVSGSKPKLMPDPHSDGVAAVTFNNLTFINPQDDTLLVSGDANGRIYLWNNQNKPTAIPDPSGGAIQSLAFSNDDEFLVMGDKKGNVYECACNSNNKKVNNPPVIPVLAGQHTTDIVSVAVNPQTDAIAAADASGVILLGNAKSAQRLPNLAGRGVTSVAFSLDGRYLAAGASDGYVYLFSLPTAVSLPASVRIARWSPDMSCRHRPAIVAGATYKYSERQNIMARTTPAPGRLTPLVAGSAPPRSTRKPTSWLLELSAAPPTYTIFRE